MALDPQELEGLINAELVKRDIVITGEYAMVTKISASVAVAVIIHFLDKAEVVVNKGSSAGTYKIT